MSQREQILAIAVWVVTTLGLFKYGYLYYGGKDSTLVAQISNAKSTLSAQKMLLDKYVGDRSPSSVTGGDLQKYYQVNQKFTNFLRDVAEGSHDGKIKITRLVMDNLVSSGNLSRINYVLETTSTFLQLGQFVEGLEKSNLMVSVGSMEVQGEPSDLQRVHAKMILSNYVVVKE